MFAYFTGGLDKISMAISTTERMTYLDVGKKTSKCCTNMHEFFSKNLLKNSTFFVELSKIEEKSKP